MRYLCVIFTNMKKILFVACAAVLFLTVACKDNARKSREITLADTVGKDIAEVNGDVVSTADFEVTMPGAWEKKEQVLKPFRLVMLMAPMEDNFHPNLNILNDELKGRNMEEYLAFNLKQMEPMHLKMEGQGDYKVGDLNGQYMEYTYNYEGKDIAIKSFVFLKGNKAWVLTGSCLTGQAESYVPQFEEIVNSFKLK